MAESWFEEWFDSPLYEKLYTYRDEEEAKKLIGLLEKHISVDKQARILDLGCGRGRHALNLARKGYRVKGIDLSKAAIRKAREKAEREKLENVEFEIRDMRDPLPEKFDVVVNLFTTFGYFESDRENERILDSVVSMLKQNGLLVLDYMNSERVRSTYVPAEEGEVEGIEYRIKRWIKDNAIRKEIRFSGGELEQERSYSEYVKLYDLDWFKKAMNSRGLQIEQLYGDYSGEEYESSESPRLMLVARLTK